MWWSSFYKIKSKIYIFHQGARGNANPIVILIINQISFLDHFIPYFSELQTKIIRGAGPPLKGSIKFYLILNRRPPRSVGGGIFIINNKNQNKYIYLFRSAERPKIKYIYIYISIVWGGFYKILCQSRYTNCPSGAFLSRVVGEKDWLKNVSRL